MAHADVEPIGRLERTIQPTLNRFRLNAEMGVNTVLSPDAARATAQAFDVLARTIDTMEAERTAVREMARAIIVIVGAIAAIIVIGLL